jgi:hypothetical protein
VSITNRKQQSRGSNDQQWKMMIKKRWRSPTKDDNEKEATITNKKRQSGGNVDHLKKR